jgi:hypothetical protein
MKLQIVFEDAVAADAASATPSKASSAASSLLVDARCGIDTNQLTASGEAR